MLNIEPFNNQRGLFMNTDDDFDLLYNVQQWIDEN